MEEAKSCTSKVEFSILDRCFHRQKILALEFDSKKKRVITGNYVATYEPDLPGNPHDGHTLTAAPEQTTRLTGVQPREAYVDRGYRGHGLADKLKVWIAGAKRGVTVAIKKKLKRRNAVELVIGHMKSDGRLGRNFLKGVAGDAMNALLCGAGHNLRKILRQLALLCARYGITLDQWLARIMPNLQLAS